MDCPQAWRLAHRWLDQCKNHELCTRRPEHWLADEDWLPTRLIYWDPFDESHVRVVVVEEKTAENLRPYVTLSHCWGNVETLKLTTETIGQLTAGIPTSALPNLLFDAVTIARKIGARSPWVDKMCIIQDSEDDWRREAALMQHVYANTFCNIAALHARDDTEKILRSRNPAEYEPFKLLIRSHPSKTFHVFVHQPHAEHSLLSKRGWCFQESILSPRSLCFGKSQMEWECRSHHASEAFPVFEQHSRPTSTISRMKSIIAFPSSQGSQRSISIRPRTRYRYFHTWGDLVSDYSKRRLTKSSDKLIALSGVARALSAAIGEYIAGMWKPYLDLELLWRNHNVSGLRTAYRPREYQAPSWSWASLESGVCYPLWGRRLGRLQTLWTIVETQVDEVDGDPFGQLSGGFIRTRAHVVPSEGTQRPLRVDDNEGAADVDGKTRLKYKVYGMETLDIYFDDERAGSLPAPSNIVLVPAIRDDGLRGDILGLVLCRADESQYRRLGMFEIAASVGEREFSKWPESTITII